MPSPRISFVGFGEVASAFSKAMREKGADVAVYDVNLTRPGGAERLERRAKAPGIEFRPLPEALRGADFVLSTVRSQTASAAARECAVHLKPGQVFVDFNSTSPAVKREIAEIIRPSGADFVEGAILGAVGATGASTPALTGGEQGQAAAKEFCRLGLRVSFFPGELGQVSLFKMLRSIFSKGVEALLLELMVAGQRAGLQDALWEDLVRDLMTRNSFEKVASNWIQTHPGASARRQHELTQVLETLGDLGVDPLMTRSTEAFFRRSCDLGLAGAFPEKPGSVAAVVEALNQRLGEPR